MQNRQEITRRIVEVVNREVTGAEVYLFGSRARGAANEHSDWDLLILLKETQLTFATETRIMDLLYDLELELGQVFSPLIYKKKEWESSRHATSLYQHIKKEAVQLQ